MKRALVLGGGGAKGAFQVGALEYLIEVKEYKFDVIAGVSVGALNGTMLAMHRFDQLKEIWRSISNSKVYSGGLNPGTLIAMALFGKKSIYSNQPLWEMLKFYLTKESLAKIDGDLFIGMTSLVTGQYMVARPSDSQFPAEVLASTVMPIVWEDLDLSADKRAMLDGGLGHISPIGDVIDSDPDEITIINCSSRQIEPAPDPKNVIEVAMRSLSVILHQSFIKDMDCFEDINQIVKQVQQPVYNRKGKTLKAFKWSLIEPSQDLGNTLDFSTDWVQKRWEHGRERAREAILS